MRVDSLVTEVQAVQLGTRRFQVEPSVMYPAALADLQNAVETNRATSTALGTYKAQAGRLDSEAWGLALVARGEVSSSAALLVRSQALELARLWFTEHLHQHIDYGPLEIRILRNDDWRL